jgi:phytoene dehydrogenase-like protein
MVALRMMGWISGVKYGMSRGMGEFSLFLDLLAKNTVENVSAALKGRLIVMSHFTASQLKATKGQVPAKVKTLVVGAGMSSLYSAWRILENDPQADLVILEKSGRTGGRLDSDLINFLHHQVVREEEGGMRFTFDAMDDLMALLMSLDLDSEIVPFPMKVDGNNRLCFRGRSFTTDTAAADDFGVWKELYNLLPSEQNINPGSLIDTVFNRILAANPQFTERPKVRSPEFWQKFRLTCKWNDVPLSDWTLWNLFTEMGYSKECINLLYGLAGFNGTFLSMMNAGEAYQLLEDFPADPDFKTLRHGFSTLPNKLVEKIEEYKEGSIYLNTHVQSIDGRNEAGYVVTYRRENSDRSIREGQITAERIILGVPRTSLENLFNRSDAIHRLPRQEAEYLWNALQSTSNQPLLKVNLYFENAWWGTGLTGQSSVEYGPNFSDLPTGAVYPFYALDEPTIAALEYAKFMEQEKLPVPADLQTKLDKISRSKFDKPAALTIYCDYLNINFWKALQGNGPLFTSPMQQHYNEESPQRVFAASEAVVDAATGFFKQLFSTNYVPRPLLTSVRIWQGSSLFGLPPSERFDYGVHQWAVNANDAQVMTYLTEPLPNIHVCGEAYSDDQGWVEGALRSANLVLNKAFGLKSIAEVYEETHHVTPSQAVKTAYAGYAAKLIQCYIDPGFKVEQSQPGLAAAQGRRVSRHVGIKLTYFDRPDAGSR